MKRKGLRDAALHIVALAFAFLLILASSSCATDHSQGSPRFVRVLEVVPAEVELGDRVSILGDGFAPGQTARVTFRGALHRPGEPAVRGTELAVLADAVSATRLEFALDDATRSLFCRTGDRAIHTTFEGAVEVAFVPADRGAPTALGYLENVTFDVRPSASPWARGHQEEGERMLAWLGVKADSSPAGLVIEAVEPGSRAQTLGIAPGNVVTGFDGVRVASSADMLPSPEERAATIDLLLERPAGQREHRIVPLDGLRRRSLADFAGSILSVLSALGVVYLFSAPTRPGAAAALQRVVSRLRARVTSAQSNPSLTRAAFTVARHALPPSGPAAVADAVAGTLLALLPFGHCAAAARLEVSLLFVLAFACLAGAALVHRQSVWKGLRAAAAVAWLHIPAAAAVASAVVLTGSLRLREIGQAQGGWPWDWLAFRSPVSLFALGLLFACTRIDPGADVAPLPTLGTVVEDIASAGRKARSGWFEAARRAHRIIIAGLASVLFLGGWQLPGILAESRPSFPWLELAGAACVLAKTWCLVLLAVWMRWLCPRREVGHLSFAAALSVALPATTVIAATAAWTWWPPPASVQHLVSASLSVAVALAAVALAHRLHHGLTSPEGDAHLSPFL
jgi:NADH-quinone oxidoreductase subunit H